MNNERWRKTLGKARSLLDEAMSRLTTAFEGAPGLAPAHLFGQILQERDKLSCSAKVLDEVLAWKPDVLTAALMKQRDKAAKRVKRGGSAGWNRDRMNETHRKGKRSAKKQVRRAERRVGKEESKP